MKNELNFRGEINGKNLYGPWSPRSNLNLNYGGVVRFLGIYKLLRDLEMNPI